MSARILDPDRMTLADLVIELQYTLIRLRLSPEAAPLVPRFEALVTEAEQVERQETALRVALLAAEVAISWRDETIDDTVRTLGATLLKIVRNDREDPLYQRYFGSQNPSAVTRPVLGRELETVRGWVPSLLTSPEPELQDIGRQLTGQVEAADAAIQAQQAQRQKLNDFRLLGDRRRIFERVNAERREAYGFLSKMSYTSSTVAASGAAETRLPSDFGDRFFRQVRRRKDADPDVEEAREEVERLEKALAEARNQLKAAEERARAAAAAKAEKLTTQQELEQAEKAAAEAAKKIAELRERLNRK
jgi:predicted phage tail protein